jgi:hypothetical protein
MRKLHLYVGCLFAPLLIYFSLSGMWQTFRLHKHAKGTVASPMQNVLETLSGPHTDGNLGKGKNPSLLFRIFSEIMAIGFIFTALLGIQMGLQMKRARKSVIWTVIAGALLPILFLLLGS